MAHVQYAILVAWCAAMRPQAPAIGAGLTAIILNTISLQLPVPRGPVPSIARPATTPEMTQNILCVINAQYSAATALSSITQQLAQFATKVQGTTS